ncbi:hypothetical protein BJ165DRAFT_1533514 [Panaeolus papilionaceus]|nr:hypothetical protein BJ165DRAFT_1533514 [Panaeolus papilionaceus]
MTDATLHDAILATNIAQMRPSSPSSPPNLNDAPSQLPQPHRTTGSSTNERLPRTFSLNSLNSSSSSPHSSSSSSSSSSSHSSNCTGSSTRSSSKPSPPLTSSQKLHRKVGSFLDGHTAWITSNLTYSRLKPAIRCAIAGWLSAVLFIVPDVLRLMGQASFLILIASFFSPPSDPFLFVLEREFLILLFAATAWAWACLGIFVANLTRSNVVRGVTIVDVVDGKYIEAKPSIILAAFVFLGSAFFLFIKAKKGPGPYLFATVFACICMDISLTTAAFFPFPFFLVGRSILIPLTFHSALALLCSIFIFPSTVSALFTTRIIECLTPLHSALTTHLSLFDPSTHPLGSAEFSTLLEAMHKDTKKCENGLIPLASTGRLLGNDVIYARFEPGDWRVFQALCRRLVGRLDGVGMYWGLVDPKRERFPGTGAVGNREGGGGGQEGGEGGGRGYAHMHGVTPFPSMPGTPILGQSRAPSVERVRSRGTSGDRVRSRGHSVDKARGQSVDSLRGRGRTDLAEKERGRRGYTPERGRRGFTPDHERVVSRDTEYGYANPVPSSPLVKSETIGSGMADFGARMPTHFHSHSRPTHTHHHSATHGHGHAHTHNTSHVHFGSSPTTGGEGSSPRSSPVSPSSPTLTNPLSSKGQYYGVVDGGSLGRRPKKSGGGHALFHHHHHHHHHHHGHQHGHGGSSQLREPASGVISPSMSSSSQFHPLSPSITRRSGYATPPPGSPQSQSQSYSHSASQAGHHHVLLHNSLLAATPRGAKRKKDKSKKRFGGLGGSISGSLGGSLTGDEEAEVGRFEAQRYLNLEATRMRRGENAEQEEKWVREGMGLLRECCAPLLEQCISATAEITSWLGTVRGGRLGSLLKIRKERRAKEREERVKHLRSIREVLVRVLEVFRDETRTLVVEPYKSGFVKSKDQEKVFKEEMGVEGEIMGRSESRMGQGNDEGVGGGGSTLLGDLDEGLAPGGSPGEGGVRGHRGEDYTERRAEEDGDEDGERKDEREERKRKMPPHRYLFHCYVYQYHLIQIAVILIEMLDEMIRLEEERVECKLWTPMDRLYGFLKGWGETSIVDDEHAEDDDPDYIQGLHHGHAVSPPSHSPPATGQSTALPRLHIPISIPHPHLPHFPDLNFPHRRDPDALPPRNLFEALMNALHEAITSIRGGNMQFAIKAGVLSVLLCLPFFLKSSAQWAYQNRFFWAVAMGQLTIARFRGDTTFGLTARVISTFFGGLTGMVLWYISAGSGHSNPYALAATFLVCAPFFYFARLYWPIPQMTNIVFFVTAVLVIGYSYQDSILRAPGSPGSGWNVAWRRFVFVSLGVFAAFIFSYFPPATTIRRYQRQLLSTTTSEIGSIYCSILTFANTKHEPEVQEIIRSLIAVRAKLNRGGVMTVNVGYEFSLRGRWPRKRYQKIADLQMAISYSLGHLMSVIEHLDPAWARAFLRRTRFMDPDFQGDVLAVISMVSSCLRTGTPLPQVTPCPLQDRFMLRYHELEVIHKEAEEDYGLPRIMTLETLKDEQYMIFCVGVATAFAIVNRLDRLMIAAKELLGEHYHIHGIGMPGGMVMEGLSLSQMPSRVSYGPFGEDRRMEYEREVEIEKKDGRGFDDVEKGLAAAK